MATETQTSTERRGIELDQLAVGAFGGLLGSVLFGLFMQFVMPPPLLEVVIPAMYGVAGPALAVGWALHLFHGAVLGITYAGLVALTGRQAYATTMPGAVVLGVGYGLLTTVALAVIVMPIWLGALGFPAAPPFPNLAVPGTVLTTVGHLLYAVPLALLYAGLAD